MKENAYLTAGFAILTLMGGTMGYLVAGSIPSLVASSIFGVAFLLCALAMLKGHTLAIKIALALAVFLDVFFVIRLFKNPSAMPVVMILFSTALACKYIKDRQLLRS